MTPERWKKLDQIVEAALELDPEDRPAFIDSRCGDDAELRREARSLIAQQQNVSGFLRSPAIKDAAQLLAAEHESFGGRTISHYRVIRKIGAGGMGEVYLAYDTRLGRKVALKVLPVLPAFFADRAELRERFEREARIIASLNHPHICTLYDIGSQDGTDFLVMEHLEGETLAERLVKGPLPLDLVLKYGIEIADALDKAHRKGITHRDLKPGNIMLVKSGAKLLDFGLAKLKQEATPASPLSALDTARPDDAITGEGTILGTLQYMAPEQLEGKEADARTDIFAFGGVVYEMATGKKAFEGKSRASVVAKILETDPQPMASLQPMTPPLLDHVVNRCLAKEPDERWQSASDVMRELKWIAEGGSQANTAPAAPAKGFRALTPRVLLVGLCVLLLGVVITAVVSWNLKPASPAPSRPVSRLSITLPLGTHLAELNQPVIAISPDGTNITYVGIRGGTQQLYLRSMDSTEARALAETEGAGSPFFSPDGQWVGFFVGGKLKKISVDGGAAITLCDAPTLGASASWGSQGTIVFGAFASPLLQVSDAGGTPQALTRLEQAQDSHLLPEFLPGGKAVLFVIGLFPLRIGVYSLETGEQRNLIQDAISPHYISSGYLVYSQNGTLMAVPFDARRLQVTGTAVPAVERVVQNVPEHLAAGAQYSISRTGSLVYVTGNAEPDQRQLVWVTRGGVEQPLPAHPHAYRYPRLSPDGDRVAVMIEEGAGSDTIWVYDLRRDTLTRLTSEGTYNLIGAWTPDGRRIAFSSNKEGPWNLFWQRADGSGGPERLTTSEYNEGPSSWSPDGQALAFVELNPKTGLDIWVLRMGDRKAQPFVQPPSQEDAPTFSPDGHWLAYVSNETGRGEVYVQPYPGPGGKYLISTGGGYEPVWSHKGGELFYRNGDKMMAVEVTPQPGFSVGKPRMLFERPYAPTSQGPPDYDVSADGQRFLMLKGPGQTQAPTQINVVLNWTEELKRLVGTGKK